VTGPAPNHERSRELMARARRLLPGGVNSNVRLSGPPLVFTRGQGAWLWDADGNDYVDYLLGQGPDFLGHAPASVCEAVEEACRTGMVFAAQHELEVEAAELFCRTVAWADMVRFGLTGTEMVQAALRLARAATGRRRFVRFEGHYHGWLDNVLISIADGKVGPGSAGQLPDHLEDSIVLPWNDPEGLEDLLSRRGEEVAAVIMEPVMINAGVISPAEGYLERARAACDAHGAVLIFDEVISGFRVALGGAAERFGVKPDLATYGKAMAGGWPVAALAGRADLMERFGTGEVNHSGTMNGSVMGMAAVAATLKLLTADPPYERLTSYGTSLMASLAELAAAHGVPMHLQGLPMAFHVSFGDQGPVRDHRSLQALDLRGYEAFATHLVDHGVWVAGRGVWYVSTAHGETELEATVERVEKALAGWNSRQGR
jgi:glutamate-1-semialdehyde 2,1-aminomutase